MKKETQRQINRTYHTRIKNMLKGSTEREIFESLAAGKNTYLRLDRLQSSSFDVSWIEEIENVIFDLGEIIANPRQNTKTVGNIVPVELARKTGAESVQHLASHTQYIKEIDEYGNVIPSKIMTMVSEDDLHTYENRFIATLVRRLLLFVEKRYEIVSEFAELRNEEILMFKNKSVVNGAEVEIETKVKVSYKSDDEQALKSNAYIERIAQIREYILYFYNSQFMRQLKTERDVRNPILQTNIIRKNPKYHHCYEVYRFIETYDRLGVNYKVDENYSIFNEEELNELNHTLFANYITLRGKDLSDNHKTNTRIYKPRILTSMDDEEFIYGPYLKGPISFVRVDEPYQDYLDSKLRKDLPLHPTKKEKEYYADEYEARRENKEDLKEKNNLLKRKNKELLAFEKSVQKILKEREEARLKLLELEKQIISKEESELLAKAREEIIAASRMDQKQVDEALVKQEEERKLAEIRESIAHTKVVEPSHPESKPVTYEEAVLDIWPNSANAPAYRVEPKEEEPQSAVEEPFASEAPVQEIKVVEPSHPHTDPVSYEEAVAQIWPNVKDAPVLRVAPKEEKVVAKKAVKKEKPQPVVVEEQPVPQPKVVEPSHPYSEPVTYDEAALEIWPNLANEDKHVFDKVEKVAAPAPVKEEAPVVEEPVEQPQPKVVEATHPYSKPVSYDEAALEIWPNLAKEDKHVFEKRVVPVEPIKAEPKKKPEPKKDPAKKKAAPKKEKKVVEPAPAPEAPVKEEPQPVVEEPVEEPAPVVEEPQPELVKEEQPKVEKKPQVKKAPVLKKAAPKKAPEKKPEPVKVKKPVQKKEEPPREKIPGRFIVKTNNGYYVAKNKYSVYKTDAKVFDDFNLAHDIKNTLGGKIVKL